ncbi:rod shape-determining protein MreD [Falsiroseomonas sp. HW251]|uniref:rod shape-determining protein MreD n=1 Tax=Falsiroseomonas sp. HW251 TaxID=3390998 RepID=UPI003D3226D1
MVGRPEPSPSLIRRIEGLARALLPPLLAAVTLIAAAGPTGMPALVPAVALPQVFFWSVFRPGSMSPPTVFSIGLLLDLLSLAPIGTGVFTLLVAHGLAVAWRRFLARQGFWAVWVVFGCFTVGAAALSWLLIAVLSFSLPPPEPMLMEAALSAGLYPIFAFVLGRLHQVMLRAEEAL